MRDSCRCGLAVLCSAPHATPNTHPKLLVILSGCTCNGSHQRSGRNGAAALSNAHHAATALIEHLELPAGAGQVDVWALGISAVEMAEVAPPRWAVHPMRVIFMISRDPPPQLADRDRWSLPFHDFVAQCLQKVNPPAKKSRAGAHARCPGVTCMLIGWQ